MALEPIGETQRELLRALLRDKPGLTIDELAAKLEVSRNAVRQHLAALEGVGWIARGARRASGGRPEQLYVLTDAGKELFPRQYSWFSELLIDAMREGGDAPFEEKLTAMGKKVGASIRAQTDAQASIAERVNTVSEMMIELGYDATTEVNGQGAVIEAQNCVFHQLAMKQPTICNFDLAMLEAGTGMKVEHRMCMARGEAKCCFALEAKR